MNTQELIAAVVSLPVEERALAADTLLKSLDPPEANRDRQWAAVAQRRLAELRSGRATAIPGAEVFSKVQRRFHR